MNKFDRVSFHKSGVWAAAGAVSAFLTLTGVAHADALHWSGDVDNNARISLHHQDVHVDADKNGVSNVNQEVHGNMHRGSGPVRLVHVHGRGRVRIVQQPNPGNHFTAVVEIHDRQGGAGHYDFTLVW